MDSTVRYLRLARQVRLVWRDLTAVSSALADLGKQKLAAESFDLELELCRLHAQLLELAQNPFPTPSREQPSDAPDDVPF